MSERQRLVALLVAGLILTVGAGVHAWSGRTIVEGALDGSPSRETAQAVLQAGWQLGSVALLTFGLLVLNAVLARHRGRPTSPVTLWIIAMALFGFGISALVLGDRAFLPFYAGYLVLGGLVAVGAGPPD